MNGNVTKQGITADLEAMHRVGIESPTIVVVGLGMPPGPVRFQSALFYEMVRYAATEAKRLGMTIGIENCAGWSSSGGPWVKPEDSMQNLVSSEDEITGPQNFSGPLPQPPEKMNFYRDVRVLAFPQPMTLPSTSVPLSKIVDLTAKLDSSGIFRWEVPAGKWTVLRFGYTTNGMTNHPAAKDGTGLEVNKLSREAARHYWAGMFDPLSAALGPLMGTTLDHTLIDSYEVGGQNWSPTFAADFQRLRGYDLLPYLPVFTGRMVESKEISDRVLWDVRRTIADLYAENYFGYFATLAHQTGLKLELEPYGNGPFEDILSGRDADRVMGEFWWGHAGFNSSTKLAASIAHIYGKTLVGAEAFTSGDGGWDMSPPTMKALGDRAFAAGINSFTFHRYAMQPWLNRWPGMTMAIYGSNLERTNTWWNQGRAWLTYLSRCQYLLQQGVFVGDVLFFDGEGAPAGAVQPPKSVLPQGYDYDSCDADVILHRLSVHDGRLVLPNGASYRVLVLPNVRTATPAFLRKLKELADAGAVILGPKPEKSPSLSGFPQGDDEVRRLAHELWDGGKITDELLPSVLARLKITPDFQVLQSTAGLLYLHRASPTADLYFVSNQASVAQDVDCLFRVAGKLPELWHPDTGTIEKAAAWSEENGCTRVPLHLDPIGSVFVVFRQPASTAVHPIALLAPGRPAPVQTLSILHASYGAKSMEADVTAQVAAAVKDGALSIPVENSFFGSDPAPNVVKRLKVDYLQNGQAESQTVSEGAELDILPLRPLFPAGQLVAGPGSGIDLVVRQAGTYTVKKSDGTARQIAASDVPAPEEIGGAWDVTFPPHWGAPEHAIFPQLMSWSDSPDAGIKYFSGTATYRKTMNIPAAWLGATRHLDLDLGDVQVIAEVNLNGHDLGILWKPPYAIDISKIGRPGANDLEIAVTNLWPNRIIGDAQLPEDCDRGRNGAIRSWPQWLLEGKPSPTGRLTFATWPHWKKGDPLFPSGLIGPVTLRPAVELAVP